MFITLEANNLSPFQHPDLFCNDTASQIFPLPLTLSKYFMVISQPLKTHGKYLVLLEKTTYVCLSFTTLKASSNSCTFPGF